MEHSNGNGNGQPAALRNHVAIVLDESGSMEAMRQEAIDAFNEQVSTIRAHADGQETTVSLVKFSTNVPNPVYWLQPLPSLQPIGCDDYAPGGMTAMLDAVGLTIKRLSGLPDAGDEDTSFLVIIISDGQENNSKRFTHKDIAERIQELDKTDRWTFTYLGANQDLSRIARDLSIPAGNLCAFVADPAGMVDASMKLGESSQAYFRQRRAGLKSSKSFYAEPEPPPQAKDDSFWRR